MDVILQFLVDAASLGSFYAMLALGLALLFGVMGIMNFAYGELVMIGAFALWALQGQHWLLSIIGVVAATALASLAQDRIAFRPVRTADMTTMLVTAFALSIFLQNVVQMTIGVRPRGVRPPEILSGGVFVVGGVRISTFDVFTIVLIGALLVGLALLLTRTHLGLQLRAASHDFEMARMLGIRADTVIGAAFVITGVLAGFAAIVYTGRIGSATATMGLTPLLIAFVGTVLGGMRNLVGAAVGGFILGALISAMQVLLPEGLRPYRLAFVFLLVIVILLFRPQGLIVSKRSKARVV